MRKSHIVDDVAEFEDQQVQFLKEQPMRSWKQNYHVMSIIGSQSSGKSTLLNEMFQTGFDVLNRKERIGQTTKGVWMAVDTNLKIVILDVEGSDSKERQDTRTKTERTNSLFALAISNSLIVNIWKHQLGLWKGSQLAILEIVLELNLKLFKSERPKEIIFVIRDYDPDTGTAETKEAIRRSIFDKVEEAWNKVAKPPGTENIKLQELFLLNIFYLPSFKEDKELFREEVAKLRQFMIKISQNPQLIEKNVLMENMPQYLKNLWTTIQNEKDLNLPAEKILIANLRCNEIKKEAFEKIQEHFNRVIDKAALSFNPRFVEEISEHVNQALHHYDKQSQFYPKEEVEKIREEFIRELQHTIFSSFKAQVSFLSAECIEDVTKKLSDAGTSQQSNDSSIKKLNQIRKSAEEKFRTELAKIAYRSVWTEEVSRQFVKDLAKAVEVGKNKILMDYLSQLDSIFKKKIDVAITSLLKDRRSFTEEGFFWAELKKEYANLVSFGQNGIRSRLQILELGNKSFNEHYFERSKSFCYDELRSIAIARIKDINYYLSRHFKNEFNLDQRKVPRNWPDIPEEKIDELYKRSKKTFEDSIIQFQYFNFDENKFDQIKDGPTSFNRMSTVAFTSSANIKPNRHSEMIPKQEMILQFDKIDSIKKSYNEMCENEYKEAKRKHNDKYKGRIPKWMLVLLAVFMIDDVLLWFKSPALIIPVTVLGIVAALVVHKLGMGPARALLNQATSIGSGVIGNVMQGGSSAESKKKE